MVNLPEALLSRTPTATNPGESAVSMAISHTTSPATMSCHLLIREWHVYKKGVAPAPKVVLHHYDPRQPCPKPNVVFVLGGPGSGKGTMCELAEISTRLDSLVHWRSPAAPSVEAGGPTAATIEEFITAGKLVPNEIIVTLLKNAMENSYQNDGKEQFPSRWIPPLAE